LTTSNAAIVPQGVRSAILITPLFHSQRGARACRHFFKPLGIAAYFCGLLNPDSTSSNGGNKQEEFLNQLKWIS
jgi:hypothetical protein